MRPTNLIDNTYPPLCVNIQVFVKDYSKSKFGIYSQLNKKHTFTKERCKY